MLAQKSSVCAEFAHSLFRCIPAIGRYVAVRKTIGLLLATVFAAIGVGIFMARGQAKSSSFASAGIVCLLTFAVQVVRGSPLSNEIVPHIKHLFSPALLAIVTLLPDFYPSAF